MLAYGEAQRAARIFFVFFCHHRHSGLHPPHYLRWLGRKLGDLDIALGRPYRCRLRPQSS
jgi:hypothetical protein